MDEPIVELISYADHTHSCKVCETGDHDDCDCGYNDAHAKMWAAWEALKAENERLADAHNLQKRLKDESVEYSVKLQRLIERYCHGDPLPYPELHHSQMLAKQIPKDDGKYAESMRWGAREPE